VSLARKLPVITGETYPPSTVRPRTRGDCVDGPRPCPFVACRQHLLIHSIGIDREPRSHFAELDEMPETCALDVADRGPHGFREIGEMLNVSHALIEIVVNKGLAKMRAPVEQEGLAEGWTSASEGVPDSGAEDVFDGEFKAQVTKAFERIVPEFDRGTQLLRWKSKGRPRREIRRA
jgi:hypothetical protein